MKLDQLYSKCGYLVCKKYTYKKKATLNNKWEV